MKFVKAPVLFAFFATLVSFTAMASLGEPVSAGGKTISTATPAPQAKKGDLNLRAVEAAERSATAAEESVKTNGWLLGASIIAAAVAAISAIFNGKIALDSKKYNKIDNRAYVGVEKLVVSNFINKKTPIITIHIKNFGKTPTFKVKIKSKLEIKPEDFFTSNSEGDMTLWPNQTECIELNSPITVNECLIEDFRNGSKFLLRGEINYMDIYRDHHKTPISAITTNKMLSTGTGEMLLIQGNRLAD